MGFDLGTGVSALTVFFQGLLSFFSPCVLPLVPLYAAYLAGGAGAERSGRGRVLLHTLCFVAGISAAFFILGLGFTALGRFFSQNRVWFARGSGVIMVALGLYQLGAFGRVDALSRERRLPLRLDRLAVNPVTALVLGFTFSFAWTPCVGPVLSSVLLMASSAGTAGRGFLLIGVYTLGFVIPFLAIGLSAGAALKLFQRHRQVVKYTVKAGAVLLILMGVMTFTGWVSGAASYLSSLGTGASQSQQDQGSGASSQSGSAGDSSAGSASSGDSAPEDADPGDASDGDASSGEDSSGEELPTIPAPDFTLTDQHGQSHTLSDYRGKTVFLNFWATWCGPCQNEMPEIQDLYLEWGENQGELIVLGVANPKTEDNPRNQDVSQEEVEAFLEENGYTFPVVMDTTGELFSAYGIWSFPTTFMIDREGNIFGYVSGQLSAQGMASIVEQTMTGQRVQ